MAKINDKALYVSASEAVTPPKVVTSEPASDEAPAVEVAVEAVAQTQAPEVQAEPASETPAAVEEPAGKEEEQAAPIAVESPAPAVVDAGVQAAPVAEAPAPVAAPAPTPIPIVAPAVKASYAPAIASGSDEFDALISKIKESGTLTEKTLVAFFEKYLIAMAPGKMMAAGEGVRHQYGLWTTISGILERTTSDEFTRLWNIVLAYFNFFRSHALGERHVFRFPEQWMWSSNEHDAFTRLLNLIHLTANPAERAAGLKQVDMNRTLAVGISDSARQRLANFYH